VPHLSHDPSAEDEGPSSTQALELDLAPRKARVFRGESIDLELSVRNTDPRARRYALAPVPGNNAVKFRLTDEAGEERGPFGDGAAAARRGVPADTDHAGYEIEIAPLDIEESVFDLLPRAGEVEPGRWVVTAELDAELAEVSASFEVLDEVPAPLRVHETWDYDRGARSDGLLAWSTDTGEHAGTYLRVRPADDFAQVLANRRISERVAREGLHVTRAASFFSRRRHVVWREEQQLVVVVVEDELPLAEHTLSAEGFLGAWTDASGAFVLARVREGQVVAERRPYREGQAGSETVLGPAGEGAAEREPVAAAWVSCHGPVWVGWHVNGTQHLAGARLDERGSLESFAHHQLKRAGEALWLEIRRGPQDEAGEQPQVMLLTRSDDASLCRWIPGQEPELLAEDPLPAGRLRGALLAQRLNVLVERRDHLILAPFGGAWTDLDPARFPPDHTQLVAAPRSREGKLYLRAGFEYTALDDLEA
jgi:hypothetical protein